MVAARCHRCDGSQCGRLALASLGGRDPARDEGRGPTQNSKTVTSQRSGGYRSCGYAAPRIPASFSKRCFEAAGTTPDPRRSWESSHRLESGQVITQRSGTVRNLGGRMFPISTMENAPQGACGSGAARQRTMPGTGTRQACEARRHRRPPGGGQLRPTAAVRQALEGIGGALPPLRTKRCRVRVAMLR